MSWTIVDVSATYTFLEIIYKKVRSRYFTFNTMLLLLVIHFLCLPYLLLTMKKCASVGGKMQSIARSTLWFHSNDNLFNGLHFKWSDLLISFNFFLFHFLHFYTLLSSWLLYGCLLPPDEPFLSWLFTLEGVVIYSIICMCVWLSWVGSCLHCYCNARLFSVWSLS